MDQVTEWFCDLDWVVFGCEWDALVVADDEVCLSGFGLDRGDGGTFHIYFDGEGVFIADICVVER